jgi:uncharacterized phage infection (PIP) family protein YhgE
LIYPNNSSVKTLICDLGRDLRREREAHNNTKRGRDELMDAIRALAEHGEVEIQRLTKERDEARADLAAEIKHHWDTTIKIASKLELEHNELRKKNAKLSDIAERAVERIEQENWGITEVADFWKQLRAELDQLKEGEK